jgi:hypothetical protein
VELPWALGPPAGRYLLRAPDAARDAPPTHVLVIATLGATERRHLVSRRGRKKNAEVEPEPSSVTTGRATVIDVGHPFADEAQAADWLRTAGEHELDEDLAVLNRALHMFRLATTDPYLRPVARHQALVARIGYGAGDQVADGLWSEARELILPVRRQRRSRLLQPQARLAALLGARQPPLVSEELTLRARFDLDQGHDRAAALQVMIALDAAIAELSGDPAAATLEDRLAELREQRDPVSHAAQQALAGPLREAEREAVQFTLGRIEAALRARAVAGA